MIATFSFVTVSQAALEEKNNIAYQIIQINLFRDDIIGKHLVWMYLTTIDYFRHFKKASTKMKPGNFDTK